MKDIVLIAVDDTQGDSNMGTFLEPENEIMWVNKYSVRWKAVNA